MKIFVGDMMNSSGVGFGTSGARGLVSSMTDLVCYSYTHAFLSYCEKNYPSPKKVAIAGMLVIVLGGRGFLPTVKASAIYTG